MVAFIYFPLNGAETVQIGDENSDSEDEEAAKMEEPLETENHMEESLAESLSEVKEMRLVPRDPNICILFLSIYT